MKNLFFRISCFIIIIIFLNANALQIKTCKITDIGFEQGEIKCLDWKKERGGYFLAVGFNSVFGVLKIDLEDGLEGDFAVRNLEDGYRLLNVVWNPKKFEVITLD